MPANRSLSALLRRQIFEPFRDEDLRYLCKLTHSSFAEPFRFVSADPNEFESLMSNGEEYLAFPFELKLLNDDDQDPEALIRVANVDDRIGSTVLGLPDEAVGVEIMVVLSADPDYVEYEAEGLEMVDVVVDAITVSARLVMRGLATEPCPGRVLNSFMSPGFVR